MTKKLFPGDNTVILEDNGEEFTLRQTQNM